jgi:putative transposase
VLHPPVESGQYTSIAFTERLRDAGIDASIGATGDSYDNALAETINGLFKTELIKAEVRGAPPTMSRSPPWNGSTGSTTDASTSTAATFHQPNSRPPTTVTTEPSTPLSSQTNKSPDTPSRFSPSSPDRF